MWTSRPVRHLEAPTILQIHRTHPDEFQLAVANLLRTEPEGAADMTQVDDVYGLADGTVGSHLIHDATKLAEQERIVRHLLERHVERRIERLHEGDFLRINVDTRLPLSHASKPPKLYGNKDLMIRLHQADTRRRWPAQKALEAFVTSMADLRDIVEDGVPVQFNGRIHPTVALALGATFSARRPGQLVECCHEYGDKTSPWRSDAPPPAKPRGFTTTPVRHNQAGGTTLVTVIASCTPADRQAFDGLAAQREYGPVYRIELDSWDPIQPDEGNDLARRLADELGTLSATGDLHLAFVGPWALAVLLGHHLSTVNYVSHEWDNTKESARPSYQACLRINPGAPRHLTVVMPTDEEAS